MPNSSWTETGSSISLVPKTTTIDNTGNVDYLTNTDKISLMAQYVAELATKTSLDELATTWSVSSSYYDNAVAAISTALINAGAPSNWATTWPDGTTSGPWTGIQTSLSNLWAQVATQRTALQSSISAAQAAVAQSAAISAAATDTITKLNTMALTSPSTATWASTAKPALPNSSYGAGTCWLATDGAEYQVSADGTTWEAVTVAATGLFGKILASQLTVADFTNLCANPNGDQGTDSWSGSISVVGGGRYGIPVNGNCLATSDRDACYGGWFQVAPGETYAFSVDCTPGLTGSVGDTPTGPFSVGLFLRNSEAQTAVTWLGALSVATGTGWTRSNTGQVTIPAECAQAKIWVQIGAEWGSTGTWLFRHLMVRKAASAELLVDGSITAQKIVSAAFQTTNYATDGSGNPTVGARLDNSGTALKVAPGNLQLGSAIFSDYLLPRISQALDGNAANSRVLYRGNNDVTTRGGAPNIACLKVIRRRWNVTYAACRLELQLQPTASSDNLDAMRFAKIDLYVQSAVGTSGTLTSFGSSFYLPLNDRSYGSISSDSNAANASIYTLDCVDQMIVSGYPAAIITLYNAYGPSASHCFYTSSNGDGVALTDNGTSWPSGLTGGASGGTGGGGGGMGGFCPAPWVPITLASGLVVLASQLYDGAVVSGVDEYTGQPSTGIIRHPRRIWNKRLPVVLVDGRAPEFSLNHRVLTDAGWVAVQNLAVGQTILGPTPGVVKNIGTPSLAEVIDFEVDGCHTYVSNGIFSHNMKIA